jgi:Fe-S oxidoreductase
MAAVRVLRAIGVDVALSACIPDGRAAMSQGMIDTARVQARAMATMLRPYLDAGRKIVVVEPSVLAMLHFDFRHLLDAPTAIAELSANSFDPLQLVWDIATASGLDVAKLYPAAQSRFGSKLFYHSHCQQKTCNAASQTIELLRAAGFDVVTSSVECCGMAGSFGYKHDYYELSMAVGADLFAQVRQADEESGLGVLVASGISCHEQLMAGMGRTVLHPAEVLESTL